MVACRYGIILLVFNSIAHEWAQRRSELSSWTNEDKLHINARPCIIPYENSVLWFCQCKVLYRKPAFSGCKWFIAIYDLPSSFQFPYLDQHCSSDLELVFIVSSGYAIKGKGIQSFSTHSRFVPNHFVTSPYPNSADSHPVWVGSNPKHPMLNIYRLLRGHAYGIFAWVGDVSEIERVRFLIQTIKCENAVQVSYLIIS